MAQQMISAAREKMGMETPCGVTVVSSGWSWCNTFNMDDDSLALLVKQTTLSYIRQYKLIILESIHSFYLLVAIINVQTGHESQDFRGAML